MDMPEPRLYRRLQRTLLAFFLLAALFWLVLVAFAGMILDIPATLLQLSGILPSLFPAWYSLCRMGISLIAVVIAVWMFQIYRRHGVRAMGRRAPPSAQARDEEEVIKEQR